MDHPIGFLIGFCEGSDYDSFVYIDRVIVGTEARGIRIGSAFYIRLEQWTQKHNKSYLVGEQVYGEPDKKVAMLEKAYHAS